MCDLCSMYSPIASKRCKNTECIHKFAAKMKDEKYWDDIRNKKMTNATDQRKLLEYRVSNKQTLFRIRSA